jgi:hypothetical protein
VAKRSDRPVKESRGLIVIELIEAHREDGVWYEVISSIPGNEGTFRRCWRAASGTLDHAQHRDMVAWIEHMCQLSVTFQCGIQMNLLQT